MRNFRLRRSPLFTKFTRTLALTLILSIALFGPAQQVKAAQVTSLRAVFKRLKAATASDGITITFASPTGIQTGGADTITYTFSADFTLAAEAAANFDIGLGDSGTCSSATYSDEIVALTPSSTDWGVDVTGQVITLSPDTDDTLTAGFCIKLEIGTDATTGGTGSASTVTNGAVDDDDTIAIAGAFGDTGTLAVDIITNDQITISATVDPTITFAITDPSDYAIGFGTLSSIDAHWANDAATGSTSPVSGQTFTIATNAQSGYVVSYSGATLTSGGNTISALASTNDADGTEGSEQFALALDRNTGNGTVTATYDFNDGPDYNFVPGTTTTVYSETVSTDTESVDVYYIANVAGSTEAGSYTTTLNWIATATF